MDNKKLIEALDACFGVMMQPTLGKFGIKEISQWHIPCCTNQDFINARATAEKLYYEAKKEIE